MIDQMKCPFLLIPREKCKSAANLSSPCKLQYCEAQRPLKHVPMNTVTLNGLIFQEDIPSYLEPTPSFSIHINLWQGALPLPLMREKIFFYYWSSHIPV